MAERRGSSPRSSACSARPEIRLVRRFERGLAKAVDAKRFLKGLAPLDPRAAAFLDEARVAGDLVPLLVDVAVTGEGGVKIAEVMEALFGKNEDGDVAIPYHAVRAELGLWHEGRIVSPGDLAMLREARTAARAEGGRGFERHRRGLSVRRPKCGDGTRHVGVASERRRRWQSACSSGAMAGVIETGATSWTETSSASVRYPKGNPIAEWCRASMRRSA